MANHQYSLTESVPLATLLTYLTGYGITIVPGSGSRIGSALAFGTLTTPYPGFGSRFDLPEGVHDLATERLHGQPPHGA